jgi:ribosomal protein S18 acetylase RimI-like enzyme
MIANYRTELRLNPAITDIRWLEEHLRDYNRSRVGPGGHQSFLVTVTDSENNLVGGVFAKISHGWLFVDTLWIAEELRGKRQGSNLLLQVENEARRHGCLNAWVDTFSFQARGFYEKNGYTVFGELPDYPPGHMRYFLRKSLT